MKKNLLILSLVGCVCLANAQGTWTQRADFGGTGRWGAVGFSIGTKGYVGTGGNAGGPSASSIVYNDFWEWDQATDVWTQMANFGGAARTRAVGFSIGTKGYIGTGCSGSGPFVYYNDFWEWDQATNVWTQMANFGGTPRTEAMGFSIGFKGYIGIGKGHWPGPALPSDFWEWDQNTNVWVQKANFIGSNAQYATVGFSIGVKGYMGMGWGGACCPSPTLWEWDQSLDTWTQKANLPGVGRAYAIGFSIGSKGYAGTGSYWDNNGFSHAYLKDFWEWDQNMNMWTQKADFGGTERQDAIGFAIGSKGYIGTGNGTNDFWEYCDTCSVVGIDEMDKIASISVFPNPSIGKFLVEADLRIKGELSIYNILGKKIYTTLLKPGKTEIDLSENPKGIYFCNLICDNKIISTERLIIQ